MFLPGVWVQVAGTAAGGPGSLFDDPIGVAVVSL
jgi:hypothetical protein